MARGIEQALASAVRRRRRLHAAIAAVAAILALASTLAVRFELDHGVVDGAFGLLVAVLEFVFITAIIPLVVTFIYFTSSAITLHRMLKHDLPQARLRF